EQQPRLREVAGILPPQLLERSVQHGDQIQRPPRDAERNREERPVPDQVLLGGPGPAARGETVPDEQGVRGAEDEQELDEAAKASHGCEDLLLSPPEITRSRDSVLPHP